MLSVVGVVVSQSVSVGHVEANERGRSGAGDRGAMTDEFLADDGLWGCRGSPATSRVGGLIFAGVSQSIRESATTTADVVGGHHAPRSDEPAIGDVGSDGT